ncbi:MAG: hypothetical protein LUD78_01190, partial [Clostridiales bacterium]|nr:hypothetical protein [Clostridiales bacterium]
MEEDEIITVTAAATDEGDDTVTAADTAYSVSISAENTEVEAGDTVSLTATVTVDGEEVTDEYLAEAGLNLWWWTDTWNDHTDGNSDATISNENS